eukprot:1159832-Pelagomonas_calceolata.AAC.11
MQHMHRRGMKTTGWTHLRWGSGDKQLDDNARRETAQKMLLQPPAAALAAQSTRWTAVAL